MSNPYDQPGGDGGHQDPPPNYDQSADPYGPQPYDTQQYGVDPYGSQPYGQQSASGPTQPAPYSSNPYGGGNPYGNPHGAVPPLKTNGLAIASLITSLTGLLGFFCGVLGLAAPVGLVLGIVARKQVKENPTTQTGDGIALGGIISGAILTCVMAVVLVLYVAFFGWSLLPGTDF